VEARAGQPAARLDPEHPVWELEAGYLALALAAYLYVLSPRRIVVGGGVLQGGHLLARLRRRLPQVIAGYVGRAQAGPAVGDFVVAPRFGQDAGLMGAFALAMAAQGV
jgi:fructokinase